MNGAQNETLEDMKRFLGFGNPGNNLSEMHINERFKMIILQNRAVSNVSRSSLTGFGSNEPARLSMANLVIHNSSIDLLSEYKRVVGKYFMADIQTADFKNNSTQETQRVNQWVSNATNQKITKIFDEIQSNTTFIILSAVHFRGINL